jgi:hypothetical protein
LEINFFYSFITFCEYGRSYNANKCLFKKYNFPIAEFKTYDGTTLQILGLALLNKEEINEQF